MDNAPHTQEQRQKLTVAAIEAVRKRLSTKRTTNCCGMCGKQSLLQMIQVEFEGGLHVVCRRCALSVKKAERWRVSQEPLADSATEPVE